MSELSRYLFLAGSSPFILLGVAHALATPQSPDDGKGLSPADPGVGEAMARSGLLLTRRTDMWKAWVGFNLSHSLGAVLFGVVVLLAGRSQRVFDAEAAWFVPLALLVSVAYLALGVRYWFRTPILGIALSVLLFAASWATLAYS
jgi:hypothetical protein